MRSCGTQEGTPTPFHDPESLNLCSPPTHPSGRYSWVSGAAAWSLGGAGDLRAKQRTGKMKALPSFLQASCQLLPSSGSQAWALPQHDFCLHFPSHPPSTLTYPASQDTPPTPTLSHSYPPNTPTYTVTPLPPAYNHIPTHSVHLHGVLTNTTTH